MQFDPETLPYIEQLYEAWQADPTAVSGEWRAWFEAFHAEEGGPARSATTAVSESLALDLAMDMASRQDRVDQMIRAYRVRGHMMADLDPLGLHGEPHPELELEHYELTDADLDQPCSVRTIREAGVMTVREILELLRATYCRAIGVQFMHIDDLEIKEWLQHEMEATKNTYQPTRDQQIRILTKLTDAEIFEDFLQKKFLGAKRFSLEGGETLIPLLDSLVNLAGETGIREIVIGMAHRGRLNVLANIMGKSYHQIFREFDDRDPERYVGRGDVKYHLGHSANVETADGQPMHLSMCFNPSHLEFVGPVALGRVRAKEDRFEDPRRERCMGLLIHGDSAFAGEGVVQELLNMSGLEGYTTGGTIHVIINNQIGFTTPPESARSSKYCTGVAKMLQIPIFHVNGEHPDAVEQVLRMAMDFRRIFKRDVVIDMYCYRRYGHNEGDEPAFTQPVMYQAIRRRKSVREGYIDRLLALGTLNRDECDEIAVRRRKVLEAELSLSRQEETPFEEQPAGAGPWAPYRGGLDSAVPDEPTGAPVERLSALLVSQTRVPKGFNAHPRIGRLLKQRRQMGQGKRPLDWGAAEALALAALLTDGAPVRFSGQDAGRATFSQRHAVLHDAIDGHQHIPLMHLSADQARFEVWDSPLSENGPLGFEFGYSLDTPEALVVWEAQFGDFVNTAQVFIDQFIVSSEDKWNRLSGLVLLLPHGFEGQGPEHSSARLERFLQLSAEDNIQVVNLTTPAQYFHALRRQVIRPWRKPLIVMSPKSLLRHPRCVSPLDELANGRFSRVLDDDLLTIDKAAVRRVVLCTGKVYYDLLEAREAQGVTNVALVRLEQLYPLDEAALTAVLETYPDAAERLWVQEEPLNKGAWPYLRFNYGSQLLGRWPMRCVCRKASASPATGSAASHKLEQAQILEAALTLG